MIKSTSTVSAKLIADAEQFIAEFKRAERAAQGASGKIGNEVDKMAKTLSKKFSLGDIGKSLLSGFGLGSGFAVLDTVMGKVGQVYEEHQQKLKEIEATWARATAASKEYWFSQLAPKEQAADIKATLDELIKQRDELVAPKKSTLTIFGPGYAQQVEIETTFGSATDRLEYARLTEQIAEAARKLEAADQKVAAGIKANEPALAADWAKTALDRRKQLQATIEEGNKAYMKEQEAAREQAAREQAAALEKVAEAYKDLLDPSREWLRRMDEVDAAHAAGKLSAEEHTAALALLQSQMGEANAKKDFGWFEDAAKKGVEETEALSDAARELGWAFESSFEDAILEGEKLSDVLDGLLKDILRIALRSAITAPLGNWVGGLFSGGGSAAAAAAAIPGFAGMIPGLATGGPVSAGRPYMVGEQGPELIVPRSSGTVIPNHQLGSGGNTYIIDARGTDESVVQRLGQALQQLAGPGVVERRALGAVMDFRNRGAGG